MPTLATHPLRRILVACLAVLVACAMPACASRPLASWNDGPATAAVRTFVERASNPRSPGYVPPAERIAVFDNDGTLWAEQPAYAQLLFIVDRIKALAPSRPEWKETEPFRSVLAGDMKAALAEGEASLLQLLAATHAGMTTDEFEGLVREWIASARHPVSGRPYTQMVYQPMFELLEFLRAHGFRTYIVSGGGVEFMRPWAEAVYGIPPEQVVGSSVKTRFKLRDGVPVLVKVPEVGSIDDKEGKPQNINLHIGRRPVVAVGNSDGDLPMLQWTAAGASPSLCVLVHHDDAAREWAYDRQSHVGRLDAALDEAQRRSWTVVSMRRDWRVIYPGDASSADK